MAIYKKLNKTDNREVYYIDYYDENGIRQRESTGSSRYSFAKEYLNKKRDEVSQRKRIPDRYITQVKFSDFVDNEYLPIYAKGLKSYPTIKGKCEKLKKALGDKFLHEITARVVEELKQQLIEEGAATNTINNDLNALSGIFTKAIEWNKALINPVHKVKRFRMKERKRTLEKWEQKALIIACEKEKKAPYLQATVIFDLTKGRTINP